jgi:hypothetical protein
MMHHRHIGTRSIATLAAAFAGALTVAACTQQTSDEASGPSADSPRHADNSDRVRRQAKHATAQAVADVAAAAQGVGQGLKEGAARARKQRENSSDPHPRSAPSNRNGNG